MLVIIIIIYYVITGCSYFTLLLTAYFEVWILKGIGVHMIKISSSTYDLLRISDIGQYTLFVQDQRCSNKSYKCQSNNGYNRAKIQYKQCVHYTALYSYSSSLCGEYKDTKKHTHTHTHTHTYPEIMLHL